MSTPFLSYCCKQYLLSTQARVLADKLHLLAATQYMYVLSPHHVFLQTNPICLLLYSVPAQYYCTQQHSQYCTSIQVFFQTSFIMTSHLFYS